MSLITDDEAMACYKYLHSNAQDDAIAKAQVAYTEEFKKVVKAQIMAEKSDLSVAAREIEALIDERYIKAVTAWKEAIQEATRRQYMRAAYEAKFSAWQTMSANNRVSIR